MDMKSLLAQLSPEQLKEHRKAIDLRDKFVAHSINGYEQSVAVYFVEDDPSLPRGVQSVTVANIRRATMSAGIADDLRSLVKMLIESFDMSIQELCAEIKSELNSMPDVEVFYERPNLTVTASQTERFESKPRSRPRLRKKSR